MVTFANVNRGLIRWQRERMVLLCIYYGLAMFVLRFFLPAWLGSSTWLTFREFQVSVIYGISWGLLQFLLLRRKRKKGTL